MMGTYGPRAWDGSWDGAPDSPSAASATSAMIRAICAASTLSARGRTSCKRQVSGSNSLTGSRKVFTFDLHLSSRFGSDISGVVCPWWVRAVRGWVRCWLSGRCAAQHRRALSAHVQDQACAAQPGPAVRGRKRDEQGRGIIVEAVQGRPGHGPVLGGRPLRQEGRRDHRGAGRLGPRLLAAVTSGHSLVAAVLDCGVPISRFWTPDWIRSSL
jgi:hypothetical protein